MVCGRLQREAESARRDAAASAEDKHRMEQELAYMKVLPGKAAVTVLCFVTFCC